MALVDMIDQCSRGFIHLDMWRGLGEGLTMVPGLNNGPFRGFLRYSLAAHQDAAVAMLAKLIDTHEDAMHIDWLLRYCASNTRILVGTAQPTKRQWQSLLAESSNCIDALADQRTRLTGVRNNYFSHLKRGQRPRDTTDNAALTRDEMADLYQAVWKVLIDIYQFLGFPDPYASTSVAGHWPKLVTIEDLDVPVMEACIALKASTP